MNSRRALVALLAGSLMSGACGRLRDTRNVDRRSPAMVLLAGATEVQYFRNHDVSGREESEQLSYIISSDFPSTHAICRIVGDLRHAGWRPLRRGDDDARTESSYTQGWRVIINRKGRSDEAHVDLWDAAWTNQRGDHLSYSLTFRYPTRGPRNATSMRVSALRTPGRLVKAFRIPTGELIPEGETPRISQAQVADCAGTRAP
jgi:hypothetical protein